MWNFWSLAEFICESLHIPVSRHKVTLLFELSQPHAEEQGERVVVMRIQFFSSKVTWEGWEPGWLLGCHQLQKLIWNTR